MTRRTQVVLWTGFVLAALMCGAVALLMADPNHPRVEFKVAFMDDPLGIAITVLVLTNFGLAFIGTTPMAKQLLGREAGKLRPEFVFSQYFTITLGLYEICATLPLAYMFLRPELRGSQSLMILALPLALAGFVKFLWVDVPEMREVVAALKEDEPESEDSDSPETPEETRQSSPQ